MKKQLLKLLVCATTISATAPSHAFMSEKARGLGLASAAIGLAVMNEELSESETFGKIANFFNMDGQDLASSLVFSSALWAASYIPEGNSRIALRLGAVLPMLVAACVPKKALQKIAQLPGIKHFFGFMKDAKGLPLIGDYAQCNQLDCEGLCHTCKARKLFLTVPLAAIPFIPTLYRSVGAKITQWENERIAQSEHEQNERRNRQQAEEAAQVAQRHTAQNNYYSVLRINRDAEPNAIERAQRDLARLVHPNNFQYRMRNPASRAQLEELNIHTEAEATARMAQINEAITVLRDPVRKAAYDRALNQVIANPQNQNRPHDNRAH